LICKSCAGEGCRIDNKKSMPSDCSTCTAESLIKCDENPLGIMSFDSACKLCSCLATNHEGGLLQNTSKAFESVIKEHRRQCKSLEKEQSERVFVHDEKIQEAKDYYQKRVIELKELDKNGPEWILDNGGFDDS